MEHGIHGVFPSYVNLKALWNEYGIYTKKEITKTKTTSMASDKGIKVFELSKVKAPFHFPSCYDTKGYLVFQITFHQLSFSLST